MENKLTTKSLFAQENVRQKFEELLGKRASAFMTSVLQIASSNTLLANADPYSIYNAAAVAATLDLPLNNSLGFAYIVPYNQKFQDEQGNWQTKQVAQFQIGYKGFIQLAQRSAQFKTISASPIFEGQLIESNPLTGFKFDFTIKSDKVIGYAAYFELINGFQKTLYMTIEELRGHGVKYSKSYDKKNSIWKTDENSMCIKTVLKLLLARFAPLSIEMQKAVQTDQGLLKNDEGTEVIYLDNDNPAIIQKSDEQHELDRFTALVESCTTPEELQAFEKNADTEDKKTIYSQKRNQLLA